MTTTREHLLNIRGIVEAKDPGEYDQEGDMAKTQLRGVVRDAEHMIKMFKDEDNLPEWVQNKITKAADYLNTAHRYMMDNDNEDVKEGSARARLLKVMNKASGRTDADRQKDAEAATASRKSAEKDLADFRKKHMS